MRIRSPGSATRSVDRDAASRHSAGGSIAAVLAASPRQRAQQLALPGLQRKMLSPAQQAGVDGNVVDAVAIQTSVNFDTNHLSNDNSDKEVSRRLLNRAVPRNTLVDEATMKLAVIDAADDIEAAVATDAVVQLPFGGETAKQGVRGKDGKSCGGVLQCPTVGIKARMAGGAVEIHHLHESQTALGLDSEEAFPSLGGKKA
jgi:hypothetical protein